MSHMDVGSETAIRSFRRRRFIAVSGLAMAALCACLALLNQQQGLLSKSLDWPLALAGLVSGIYAVWQYRCPFCGNSPEVREVPMFDPRECAACGKSLKGLD